MSDDEIEAKQDIPAWAAWPVLCAGIAFIGLAFWVELFPPLYMGGALMGGGIAGITMRRMIRRIYRS